uniref:NADH-ubiquinone oxidoreductase chain 3 n=1 Tax=Dictyocaulus viviparus TaxID=29172 RepID=A0A1E1GII4_DICVI|nr:NADH dehydrogenase subunit 3 [Dictyocaulus viviparus]
MLVLLFFGLFFILIFYLFNVFLDFKKLFYSKVSVFESGFLNVKKIQCSFSVQFFVIMLIFVVFDLEIVMFLGFLISDWSSLLMFYILVMFVLLGFYMEWYFGKLLWVI